MVYSKRSFFGVSRIKINLADNTFVLMNGNTIHGAQSFVPQLRGEPLCYYHKSGPLGQIFAMAYQKNTDSNFGVIGLGIGSAAAYARKGQNWDFYEIDPLVKEIALHSKYFTFLRDCPVKYNIILGDGRLSIKKAPDNYYHLLILDVFSSDAIPVHVITREALQLYLKKVHVDGVLAFHISNNHLNLEPVLHNLAQSLNLISLVQYDMVDEKTAFENIPGKQSSIWLVMSRNPQDLGSLEHDPRWRPTQPGRHKNLLWTDDFSNIFSVLVWKK